MKRYLTVFAAILGAAAVLAVGTLIFVETGEVDTSVAGPSEMPRYRAAGLEISVGTEPPTPKVGDNRLIVELEKRMRAAAKALEFEEAARLRDRIRELRRQQIFKT